MERHGNFSLQKLNKIRVYYQKLLKGSLLRQLLSTHCQFLSIQDEYCWLDSVSLRSTLIAK